MWGAATRLPVLLLLSLLFSVQEGWAQAPPTQLPTPQLEPAARPVADGHRPSRHREYNTLEVATLEAPPLPIHVDNQSWHNVNGTLPATLPTAPGVTVYDLSHNNITGALPPTWGSDTLEELYLSYNLLTGAFPSTWWGSFKALDLLSLYNNSLQGKGAVRRARLACLLPDDPGKQRIRSRCCLGELGGLHPSPQGRWTRLCGWRRRSRC